MSEDSSAVGTVSSISELVPQGAARVLAGAAGVPPLVDRRNVYAADAVGNLSSVVRSAKPYVYVPNSDSNTVDVIDQRTFKVVEHFSVGGLPQHVVPAYDLRTLYVTNDTGNTLTPIDPNTGKPGATIPVDDPYNMYFTPNGRYAIVVAERLHRLDFRDAHTFKLEYSLAVPCAGVDHMDFSADGAYAIASCEFSGQLLKVDVARERVVRVLTLRSGAAPQDVKLSPDGRVFYVADMMANGVWLVDGDAMRVLRFIPTGAGAHGLYPSRDARYLYVTKSRRGVDLRRLVRDAANRAHVAHPRRRQPGYGKRLRRRQRAVAVRPLESGGLRDQHERRQAAREDSGGRGPARALRVAAARPLLARTHGHPALTGEGRRFPEQAVPLPAFEPEPFGFRGADDSRHRMRVGAKTAARDAQPKIDRAQAGLRPDALLRIRHEEALLRMCRRAADECVDIRITADHTVHDDDVVRLDFVSIGDEVTDATGDALLDAALGQQLGSRLFVAAGQLDVRRSLRSPCEQLELDCADAAADVEHARAPHVPCERDEGA